MKKAGYMKDAMVLCLITLVSGFLLGSGYEITKGPIERATQSANLAAYQKVFPEAADFMTDNEMIVSVEACNKELLLQKFGKVAVEDALLAVDEGGTVLGYVVISHSDDSYAGRLKISVGIKKDGTINGIEFLEISETPGLGLKARESDFKNQYAGKKEEAFIVTKSGNAGEGEIHAISGATITSGAVTNAVNAALYYVHHSIDRQEEK